MAAAKAINQRKLQEECRLTHRNVKLATKDSMGAPYQMELTTTNGTVVYADKDQIEQTLISEYQAKYRLAHSSPLLEPPLSNELGPFALNEASTKILQGSYVCPPHLKKHTRKFIQHLEMDDDIKTLDVNKVQISVEANAML